MSSSQPHPSWFADTLLKRVLKNSGYLFSATTISAALGFVQGILVVRLIGIENYGLLVGTIFVFVTNVNRLLSFRMSEVTVKYLSEALARNDRGRAAALAKGIGLIEAATSVVAYLVLLALTPWAARFFTHDASTALLFIVYGLFLLGNLVYETSTGVLQAYKRFDCIAAVNLVQSIVTFVFIGASFLWHGNLWDVLEAYLIGKVLAGITIVVMAVLELNRDLGTAWWQATPLSSFVFHLSSFLPDWRAIISFALNTNLNGTVTLIVRDSAPLFLAPFATPTEVGYFKLALSLINLVMLPIEPFIWPTYAELTETVARAQWDATKRLLRRVSAIAAAWTLAAGGGLAAIGWWLIPFLYGADAAPAYPATVILLLGFGFANILHWNRPLLLAFGKPSFPLLASALVGAMEIILIFLLVPSTGYLGMSWLMSAYFIFSIGIIVWKGLSEIQRAITTYSSPITK